MANEGLPAPPGGNDWGAFASSQPGSLPSPTALSNEASIRSIADVGLSARIDTLSAFQLSGLARLSSPNVFTEVNKIPGLRVGTFTVGSDYLMTSTDFEVLVDASSGPVVITLPAAMGNGQYYRVKKIDSTANVVTVAAAGTDVIDDSISVILTTQWSDVTLIDAAFGFWDNTGASGASVTSAGVNSLITSVEQRLSTRIDGVSVGASVTSAAIHALVQTASAAGTAANVHANTVSVRLVSVSAELNSLLNSVEHRLSIRIDAVSGAGGSVTSQEVSALVQTASAAATSADAHANTVSARAVSISAELGSLIQIASAAATSADSHADTASAAATSADTHANTVSARLVSASAELASLVQTASAAATSADAHANTASAAATSADAHANTVSARVVSVSAELASLVQIASAAATSADGHANTVSARAASISAELNSLLNSIESRLSTRIDTASSGGSVTSAEVQVASAAATSADAHAAVASAAATSADAHANTVSARLVSASAELGSLIQIASAAATSADSHANTVSARAASISAELASLVQIASAAATSVNARLDVVSANGLSASVHLGLQNVVNTLSARIQAALALEDTHASTASAAATSADAHANTVSARLVSASAELGSLIQIASAAATSADSHANTVSARLASASLELVSLVQIASAAATSADTHANTASAAATSADAHANTASAAATSADAHANTVSARLASASLELVSLVQIASAAATSADAHANTVSARLASASLELVSLVQIASAAATSVDARLTSVSALIKTDINSVSAAIKTDIASVSAAIKTDIASVSAAIKTDTTSAINVLSNLASNWVSVTRYIPQSTQTADYTLVLGDAGTEVQMNKATAINLTVPPNSSVAFPVGTQIVIEQLGAGTVTIVAGAGVTLQGNLTTKFQYSSAVLIKQATDTWQVTTQVDLASISAVIKTDINSVSAAIMADVASHMTSLHTSVTAEIASVSALINNVSSRTSVGGATSTKGIQSAINNMSANLLQVQSAYQQASTVGSIAALSIASAWVQSASAAATSVDARVTSASAATSVWQGWTGLYVITNDFTTTNTTATDITGLVTGTLTASTLYQFDFCLRVLNGADVNGMKIALHGGGTGSAATVFCSYITNSSGAGNAASAAINAVDTLGGAIVTYSSGEGIVMGHGYFTTRSTGTPTFSVQIAKVTGNTATVRKGSYLRIRLATIA